MSGEVCARRPSWASESVCVVQMVRLLNPIYIKFSRRYPKGCQQTKKKNKNKRRVCCIFHQRSLSLHSQRSGLSVYKTKLTTMQCRHPFLLPPSSVGYYVELLGERVSQISTHYTKQKTPNSTLPQLLLARPGWVAWSW